MRALVGISIVAVLLWGAIPYFLQGPAGESVLGEVKLWW